MIVQYNHNTYRVDVVTGDVDVLIERTQLNPRSDHWRRLKRSSETALRVRIRAFNAERKAS